MLEKREREFAAKIGQFFILTTNKSKFSLLVAKPLLLSARVLVVLVLVKRSLRRDHPEEERRKRTSGFLLFGVFANKNTNKRERKERELLLKIARVD